MCQRPYAFPGDPELAGLIADAGEQAGTWITPIDDPYLPIHYPTVNLLPFLQGSEHAGCGSRHHRPAETDKLSCSPAPQ